MKSRISATILAMALLHSLGGVDAAEKKVLKAAPALPRSPVDEFHTSRHIRIRHLEGNVTLEQAVNLALQQNPQILIAIQEIERTRGQIIQVRAAALPHITATGIYQQQDRRLLQGGSFGSGSGSSSGNQNSALTSNSVAQSNASGLTTDSSATGTTSNRTTAATAVNGSTTTADTVGSNDELVSQLSALFSSDTQSSYIQNKSWNVQIQVQQALYAGGQIRAALNIARLANDSAYYSLRDVIDSVIATTRQQFYNVLLTRALIIVQEESVRLLEQQRQDQQNRFEAGTVPRFNVLQAEVALSNARPDLIRARNNYLLAQIQLSRTLNLEPGPSGRSTFNCVGVLNASTRKINLEEALGLARARRPYLKVQRQTILIDVENITVEMAGYKPRIDGQAGYQFRNRSGAEDLSDVVNGWFFGFTGSWDIFDGFATYGAVKQARARLDQSKINYIDAVHQVDLEVETAYINLQQARETIASQQKNIEEATEAVRLAQERLSAGAGTQLEVLDARVQLTRARSTELQARADYNNALADFDRATATNTVYHEDFKDPLEKTQKGIFAKLAETGLPKSSVMARESDLPAASVEAAERSERKAGEKPPHVEFYPALSALPGVVHGFTLRVPGIDVQVDREAALARLDGTHAQVRRDLGVAERVFITARQVHGRDVAVVDARPREGLLEADGLITSDPRVCLGIYAADCCVVFLVDPRRRVGALLHSGRKGSELGITTAALTRMVEEFGCDPVDIVVQLSPCIRPPQYEIDFAALIIEQARAAGVRQIHDGGLCTASHPERYYSYRRELGRTGRMLALLAL